VLAPTLFTTLFDSQTKSRPGVDAEEAIETNDKKKRMELMAAIEMYHHEDTASCSTPVLMVFSLAPIWCRSLGR